MAGVSREIIIVVIIILVALCIYLIWWMVNIRRQLAQIAELEEKRPAASGQSGQHDLCQRTKFVLNGWFAEMQAAGVTFDFDFPDTAKVQVDENTFTAALGGILAYILEHSNGDHIAAMIRKENGMVFVCVAENGNGLMEKIEQEAALPGGSLAALKCLTETKGWVWNTQAMENGGTAFFIGIPES